MSDYVKELRSVLGTRPIILVGATVIVWNERSEILLQHRSDTKNWGLPGGHLEPGENLEQTARRELFEETGLEAESLRLLDVFSGPQYFYVYPNGDQVHSVIMLYEATEVRGELQPLDGESLELKYFPLQALPDMETRAASILEGLSRK